MRAGLHGQQPERDGFVSHPPHAHVHADRGDLGAGQPAGLGGVGRRRKLDRLDHTSERKSKCRWEGSPPRGAIRCTSRSNSSGSAPPSDNAQLLLGLTRGNGPRVGLARIGMPARLHPQLQVLVEDQCRPAVGPDHEAAPGGVPRLKDIAVERAVIAGRGQPVDHRQLMPAFAVIMRLVPPRVSEQRFTGMLRGVHHERGIV